MITGHTVERLNSGATPNQLDDGQEGKAATSKPVTRQNPDVTGS